MKRRWKYKFKTELCKNIAKKILYDKMLCLYIKRSRTEFITIIKTINDVFGEKIIVSLATIFLC